MLFKVICMQATEYTLLEVQDDTSNTNKVVKTLNLINRFDGMISDVLLFICLKAIPLLRSNWSIFQLVLRKSAS